MDPLKLRPRRDWVSILDDKRELKLASGLYIPETESGAEKVSEWAGTIIRIGPGDKADKLNLKNGLRIVYRGFIKYANRIVTDEVWEDGTPKHYFLMSVDDILGVTEDGVKVGFLSSAENG